MAENVMAQLGAVAGARACAVAIHHRVGRLDRRGERRTLSPPRTARPPSLRKEAIDTPRSRCRSGRRRFTRAARTDRPRVSTALLGAARASLRQPTAARHPGGPNRAQTSRPTRFKDRATRPAVRPTSHPRPVPPLPRPPVPRTSAAGPAVVAGGGPGRLRAGPVGIRRLGGEHVLAGRREREVAAGIRKRGSGAVHPRRPNRKPDSTLAAGPCRLQQGCGVFDGVALVVLIAGGGHEEDAVSRRVPDRAALDRRRLRTADREVDDLRAVLHGVDDGRSLVHVRDVAVLADCLDDQKLRVASEAGDADTVVD